jgi:hypothetical protein
MHRIICAFAVCVMINALGCTGQDATDLSRFNLDQQTTAIGHANSMRGLIDSLQHQLKSEGLPGLKSELITLDERLEEFSDDEIEGEERKTYDLMIPKLKELANEVHSGNVKRAELTEMLQELETLALDLPQSETPAGPG